MRQFTIKLSGDIYIASDGTLQASGNSPSEAMEALVRLRIKKGAK